MTRVEFMFLLRALKRLCQLKDYEGLEKMIDEAIKDEQRSSRSKD